MGDLREKSPLVSSSSPTGGAFNILWTYQRHFSFGLSEEQQPDISFEDILLSNP